MWNNSYDGILFRIWLSHLILEISNLILGQKISKKNEGHYILVKNFKKLSTKQNIYIKTQTMTHYSEILEHYRKNKNKKFKSV